MASAIGSGVGDGVGVGTGVGVGDEVAVGLGVEVGDAVGLAVGVARAAYAAWAGPMTRHSANADTIAFTGSPSSENPSTRPASARS